MAEGKERKLTAAELIKSWLDNIVITRVKVELFCAMFAVVTENGEAKIMTIREFEEFIKHMARDCDSIEIGTGEIVCVKFKDDVKLPIPDDENDDEDGGKRGGESL